MRRSEGDGARSKQGGRESPARLQILRGVAAEVEGAGAGGAAAEAELTIQEHILSSRRVI